jgi:hypothetical protein
MGRWKLINYLFAWLATLLLFLGVAFLAAKLPMSLKMSQFIQMKWEGRESHSPRLARYTLSW